MVGVVSHFKFATPSHRKYKNYIKYMARDEAKRAEVYRDETNFALDDLKNTDYDNYNKYMSNPEKTSGLFNNSSNQLSNGDVQALKKQFQAAQKADSNMWQIVVSFDNEWLEKFGAYNSETHEVDEAVVMNSARNGMNKVLEISDMQNAVWSGAIHYNTDNIHIHLAIVEPCPSKEKKWYKDKETGKWKHERPGYMPYKAIDNLKSQVANHIADRSKERIKFDTLIRDKIGNREELQNKLHASFQMQKMYKELHQSLPENKQLWKYNNNAMNDFRSQINKISQYYIDHFCPEEFEELKQSLDKENDFIKETYGESKVHPGRFNDYKENKMHTLYSNMGNTILKDLMKYDEEVKGNKNQHTQLKYQFSQEPRVNLQLLKRSFQKSREEVKRQQEFEQLQWEIDHSL